VVTKTPRLDQLFKLANTIAQAERDLGPEKNQRALQGAGLEEMDPCILNMMLNHLRENGHEGAARSVRYVVLQNRKAYDGSE
jgi:hypothetical protein